LALYKKLGFRLMGIRRGYYTIPPEDALVLGLHLGDVP
jgi:ribosomal protein S18 acetylase RimI-like enzyme